MGRKPKSMMTNLPFSTETNETSTTEKLQDVLEDLNSIEEKEKTKKPRGKAGKTAAEKAEKEEFLKGVSGVGSFGLNLIITRLPNPIPLDARESEKFDVVFDNLLYKYAGYLKDYQEESAFILVAGMIIFPRIISKKSEKKTEEKTVGIS